MKIFPDPYRFGTLETTYNGKPVTATLFREALWHCDEPEIAEWLQTIGRVVSMGNPYNARAAALAAAQRKFGGKITMITEEEMFPEAVKAISAKG